MSDPANWRECDRSLGVIGNGDVLVAQLLAREHHLIDAVPAIAPGAVHVQIAANVGRAHELRQFVAFGGVYLVLTFAKLRRDRRQLEVAVEGFFRVGDEPISMPVEQPAIVERQPEALRAGMQLARVGARSRVPDKGRASLFRHGDTDRNRPALDSDGDVGEGAREDGGRGRQAAKGVQHVGMLRLGRNGQQRHAAHRRREAPQAAERRDGLRREAHALRFAHGARREHVRAAQRDPVEYRRQRTGWQSTRPPVSIVTLTPGLYGLSVRRPSEHAVEHQQEHSA